MRHNPSVTEMPLPLFDIAHSLKTTPVETQKAAHKVQEVLCANRRGGDASFAGLDPRGRTSSDGMHRRIETGPLSEAAKRNRASSMSTPRKSAGEFLTGLDFNPATLTALGGNRGAVGAVGSPLAAGRRAGGGGRGASAADDEPKTLFELGDGSAAANISATLRCATKSRPRVKTGRRPPTRAHTRAKGNRPPFAQPNQGAMAAPASPKIAKRPPMVAMKPPGSPKPRPRTRVSSSEDDARPRVSSTGGGRSSNGGGTASPPAPGTEDSGGKLSIVFDGGGVNEGESSSEDPPTAVAPSEPPLGPPLGPPPNAKPRPPLPGKKPKLSQTFQAEGSEDSAEA